MDSSRLEYCNNRLLQDIAEQEPEWNDEEVSLAEGTICNKNCTDQYCDRISPEAMQIADMYMHHLSDQSYEPGCYCDNGCLVIEAGCWDWDVRGSYERMIPEVQIGIHPGKRLLAVLTFQEILPRLEWIAENIPDGWQYLIKGATCPEDWILDIYNYQP